jgi:hypothetical protein
VKTLKRGTVHGLRTGLSIQQPTASFALTNAYDAAKRLTNVATAAGGHSYLYAGGGSYAYVACLASCLIKRKCPWPLGPYPGGFGDLP